MAKSGNGMADLKVGDYISVDSFKVGQPRRYGTVDAITQGIAGIQLTVRWDDGHVSSFRPSLGNVVLEKRGRASSPAARKPAAKPARQRAKTRK